MESNDVADLFANTSEHVAKERIEETMSRAKDALTLSMEEAPKSNLERFKYAKSEIIPLILTGTEDGGERRAALADVAECLKLGKKSLLKALDVAEAEEGERQSEVEGQVDSYEEDPLDGVSEEEISAILEAPDLFGRLIEDTAKFSGVVGERSTLGIIALCALTSRLDLLFNGHPNTANLIVTGPAGRGKNYLCDAVSVILPPDSFVAFESSSSKALYYAAENDSRAFSNKWLYPNEAEAVDLLVEMMRPLISGGRATHQTVNKDSRGRNVYQSLTIEGPVSLVIPTVRNKLDSQLQSRFLIVGLEDYEGRVASHSRKASEALSSDYATTTHGLEILVWQAAIKSLSAVTRVVIPVNDERFCLDTDEVANGARVWKNFLALMSAHAWLNQRNREIRDFVDGKPAVVATANDYEVAYRLFKETCERSITNLSEAHRKILDALYELREEDDERHQQDMDDPDVWPTGKREFFSQYEIAKKSGVAQSTVSDNKTYLIKSLKLVFEGYKGGLSLVDGITPEYWEKGDMLIGFPRPEQVREWWHGEKTEAAPEEAGHAGQGTTDPSEAAEEAESTNRGRSGQVEVPSGQSGDTEDGTGEEPEDFSDSID